MMLRPFHLACVSLVSAFGTNPESATAQSSISPAEAVGAAVSSAQDTPARIISDHIRRQGFPCDEPRQAEHDVQASRPNGAVWTLTCRNAKYRVTLIPDMAAKVELVK